MNAQAKKVQNAIDRLHTVYDPGIKEYLEKLDKIGEPVTITITANELRLLKNYVSNRLGELHNDWFEVTHDEQVDECDMAYELCRIKEKEEQVGRLYTKLTHC